MIKTNFRNKLFLIFLGFFLSFLLLESGLRLGGEVFHLAQDYHNRSNAQDIKEYRILCIGESTTAIGGEDSYPFQLEEILNSKGLLKRFKVINKGLISKTTADILLQLDDNLSKYKPHLVIAMMGINDDDSIIGIKEKRPSVRNIFEKFRVVRFFEFLTKHLTATYQAKLKAPKISQSNKLVEINDDTQQWMPNVEEGEFDNVAVMEGMFQSEIKKINSIEKQRVLEKEKFNKNKELLQSLVKASSFAFYLGYYYHSRNDLEKAKGYLDLSLEMNPRYIPAHIELGILYREKKDYKNAILELKKAIDINDASIPAHLELGRVLSEIGRVDEAYKFYKIVASTKPKDYWLYHELGRWFILHNFYTDAQDVYQKALSENHRDLVVLNELIKVSEILGKKAEADGYRQRQQKLEEDLDFYRLPTKQNYRQIAEKILSNRVHFIAMQYPLRKIEPLQEIFNSLKGIVFVENLNNFKEALKEGNYSEYFVDRFAGDFGHATGKGNRLIAENLGDVILNNVLKE